MISKVRLQPCGPVVDLVHLVAILRGWSVKRVDWAHCSYELDKGAVVHIERRPFVKA